MLISLKIVCNILKKEVKSKPKHPRCKNKSGLGEKDVRSNGHPRPLLLIGTTSFGHDDVTTKQCYFRCSSPPDVEGIKIFDKDDQAAKKCSLYLNVLQPDHLYQNFWSHQHQETLSTWNNNVLQWRYNQNLCTYQKQGSWLLMQLCI